MRKFSIRKLFLDLLVIVCLVVVGWTGYQLFILRNLDPMMGSIIFTVGIGGLIWNIVVLRSHYYRGMNPSFKMVFLPLLAVIIILAFAGIEPLSSYKESIIDQVTTEIKNINFDVEESDTDVDTQNIVDYEFAIEFKRVFNLWKSTNGGEVIFYRNLDDDAKFYAEAMCNNEEVNFHPNLRGYIFINPSSPIDLVETWVGDWMTKMTLSEWFKGGGFAKVGDVAVLILVKSY